MIAIDKNILIGAITYSLEHQKEYSAFNDCLLRAVRDFLIETPSVEAVPKAEFDALMNDFKEGNNIYKCDTCKYGIVNSIKNAVHNESEFNYCIVNNCDGFSHWEWRGVKNEREKRA